MLHHQHSATIDRSGLQVREHLVDVVQVRFVNFRPDLALGGECDGFREVLSAAYDEPRIVTRFITTSKIGVPNSPGGRPTRLTVPLRRTIFNA